MTGTNTVAAAAGRATRSDHQAWLDGVELRPFDLPADLPALSAFLIDVHRHDDLEWRPSESDLAADWETSERFDAAQDAVIAVRDGEVVGASTLMGREREGRIMHSVEIWVRPEVRHRGLGRRLLAWAESRARESKRERRRWPEGMAHVIRLGVERSNAEGVRFIDATGYEPGRFGYLMRRPLDQPIPDLALPEGIEIRQVLPEHHRAIWDADFEAFRDHPEAALRTEEDFLQTFADPRVDTSLWQIAWDGDQVAGVVMNAINAAENERLGERVGWLEHVSVRRPWRGRGLATVLCARSMRLLRDHGMEIAALGVDGENPTGALRVYEKLGFRPQHVWQTYLREVD